MNPSCSLPPLVDIYRAGRRGSSWGPSVHGEGWEYFSWPLLGGGGTLGVTFSWSRCGARFGPLSGSISWSLRGLELGSLGPHFLVLHGPNFFCFVWSFRGLDLLGPSGLDFRGPSGPHFLGPFGGSISWSIGGSFSCSSRGLDSLLVL